MLETFRLRNNIRYHLRSQNTFKTPLRNSVYNDAESISYVGPRVCELVPHNLKIITLLSTFKEKIKKWNPKKCQCRLFKASIQHVVGFIN